jgi:uroporphyrinogen-III synthase
MYCCSYWTQRRWSYGASKPATVLHSRKVRIDRAASDPFTTREVLAEMQGTPLRGKRVVVQRYGETKREFQAELESEGADVTEIVTYRWGLPEDTAPLLRLIDALGRDEIDLVAFTSASQASNLLISIGHVIIQVEVDEHIACALEPSHEV